MPGKEPQLKPGDAVREKLQLLCVNEETGIVTETYALDGAYRCVVRFESGREGVYYERELIHRGGACILDVR